MSSTLIAERPRITRSARVDTFRKARLRSALTILWLLIAGGAFLHGIDYYLTPLAERAARSDHARFAPGGTVGSLLATVGSGMVGFGVVAYALRKRIRFLGRIGTMRSWLYVHIFLCTLGPFLLLLHMAFDFTGLASVLMWGIAVGVASGLVGRFIYQWIPKTVHGRFLAPEELLERQKGLREELQRVAACSPEQAAVWIGPPLHLDDATPVRAFVASIKYSLSRRLRKSRLSATLKDADIKRKRNSESIRLIMAESRVQAQLVLLTPFRQLFDRWHRLHVLLVALVVLAVAAHALLALELV